jgi:hypothetical protein
VILTITISIGGTIYTKAFPLGILQILLQYYRTKFHFNKTHDVRQQYEHNEWQPQKATMKRGFPVRIRITQKRQNQSTRYGTREP